MFMFGDVWCLTAHLSVDVAEFDGHVVARLAYMDLESLAPGESRSKSIFVKCLQTGIKLITFQVLGSGLKVLIKLKRSFSLCA